MRRFTAGIDENGTSTPVARQTLDKRGVPAASSVGNVIALVQSDAQNGLRHEMVSLSVS